VRIMFGVRMRCEARRSVHKRNLKLNIRAKFSSEKHLFRQNPRLSDTSRRRELLRVLFFYRITATLPGTVLANSS